MEKLVVSWSTGKYDSHTEHITCLEYESAEAFIVHLEDKIKKYLVKKQAAKELSDKWERDYPKQVSFNHKTQWIDAVEKFAKENPREYCWLYDDFELADRKFYAQHFICTEDNTIILPEILTLENWFNSFKRR